MIWSSVHFVLRLAASLCCSDPSSFILSCTITSLLLGDILETFSAGLLWSSRSPVGRQVSPACVCVCDYCTVYSGSRDCVKPDKGRIQHELIITPRAHLDIFLFLLYSTLSIFFQQPIPLSFSCSTLAILSLQSPYLHLSLLNLFSLLHTPQSLF